MRRSFGTGTGLVTVLLVSLPLAARKPQNRSQAADYVGPAARLSEAPDSAKSLRNPFDGNKDAIAAGRKLFRQHCAECHGQEGYGIGRAANLHSEEFQKAPPGVLFWAVRNGRLRQGMPSWSGLPDAQIWQLVTYLKTLSATPVPAH